MQSVGEAMAIGRTFKQAFVKAMRSRELDVDAAPPSGRAARAPRDARRTTATSCSSRRSAAAHSEAELCERTGIDPWFMAEMAALARGEDPEAGLERSFKAVDTCAAEFEAETPYYYSGWERTRRARGAPRRPAERGDPRLRARTASGRGSSSTTAACTPR